jgi:hypothetical protein
MTTPESPELQIGERRMLLPLDWAEEVNRVDVIMHLGFGTLTRFQDETMPIFTTDDQYDFEGVDCWTMTTSDWEALCQTKEMDSLSVIQLTGAEYRAQLDEWDSVLNVGRLYPTDPEQPDPSTD